MMPVINKLYKGDKEKHRAAMERHMEFFNTTPYISTAIIGITAAMEESNLSLIHIFIGGGNYMLCSLSEQCCGKQCRGGSCREKRECPHCRRAQD